MTIGHPLCCRGFLGTFGIGDGTEAPPRGGDRRGMVGPWQNLRTDRDRSSSSAASCGEPRTSGRAGARSSSWWPCSHSSRACWAWAWGWRALADSNGATSAASAGGAPKTVAIELGDLFVRPSSIDIPAGTDLTLEVTNTGAMPHDLKLEGETGTALLDPGAHEVIQLGADRRQRPSVVHGARPQGSRDGARHQRHRRRRDRGHRATEATQRPTQPPSTSRPSPLPT